MPPMLQDKVPWPSPLCPAVPMDIPGGANPVPCAQPCSCTGRGKLSSAQQLKTMLKTSSWGCWGLGLAACTRNVLGAAQEGQLEGQREAQERGGASHPGSRAAGSISAAHGLGKRTHQAQDVLPCSRTVCPWVRAPGTGDRWLRCHHLVLLLGRGQPLVWVLDCGGQEGRKSLSPRHWRAFLRRVCRFRLGSYLNGFVGWHLAHVALREQYHPAVSKTPFCCSPMVLRMLSCICSPGTGRYLRTDCPLTHPHRWQSGPWCVP